MRGELGGLMGMVGERRAAVLLRQGPSLLALGPSSASGVPVGGSGLPCQPKEVPSAPRSFLFHLVPPLFFSVQTGHISADIKFLKPISQSPVQFGRVQAIDKQVLYIPFLDNSSLILVSVKMLD